MSKRRGLLSDLKADEQCEPQPEIGLTEVPQSVSQSALRPYAGLGRPYRDPTRPEHAL